MPDSTALPKGNLEGLHEVCSLLKSGDMTHDTLATKFEGSESRLRRNLSLGRCLGFVDSDEDTLNSTDLGIEFAYSDYEEPPPDLFTQGLQKCEIYNRIIAELNATTESDGDGTLNQVEVIKILRIAFDFELSEKLLKSAANSFLEILDAAGYGDYIIGRGGRQTRIELNQSIESIYDDIVETQIVSQYGEAKVVESTEQVSETEGTHHFPSPPGLFDEEIISRCSKHFNQGEYQTAIYKAFLVLEERIREEGGFPPELVSTELATRAFHYDDGPLSFGETDAEQEGIMNLYRSGFQSFRNPSNHRFLEDLDVQRTYQILTLVNLLLTLIEEEAT